LSILVLSIFFFDRRVVLHTITIVIVSDETPAPPPVRQLPQTEGYDAGEMYEGGK
jgi:hypothetical protein